MQASKIIITANPIAQTAAWKEISSRIPTAKLQTWLEPGIGLIDTEVDWSDCAATIQAAPPIFCRHICPAGIEIQITNTANYLSEIIEHIGYLIPKVNLDETFSVQTRLIGDKEYPVSRFEINQAVSELIKQAGATLEVKAPEQVISIVCSWKKIWLGVSSAVDNLSDWAGGERRFAKMSDQVSRAEFKLLEALDVFDISLPVGGFALDMGAAPGGWTRILHQYGLRVIAVDPAMLDPSVKKLPGVKHVPKTIQQFLPDSGPFDVIVNDMRMDVRESAKIMLEAVRVLKAPGIVVMTLKLPARHLARVADQTIEELGKKYEIVGARQLFHNRNEITAVLQPMKTL